MLAAERGVEDIEPDTLSRIIRTRSGGAKGAVKITPTYASFRVGTGCPPYDLDS